MAALATTDSPSVIRPKPDCHRERLPVEHETGLDLPRPHQRIGLHRRVDLLRSPASTRAIVGDESAPFDDLQPLKRDPLGIEAERAAEHAATAGHIGQVDMEDRPLHRHLDDADLALQKRREFDLGAEALHLHVGRFGVPDDDVGEAQDRRRQKAHVRLSGNRNRPADIGRGLPLECLPIGRPVDEMRPDQSREQDHDDETADGNEELAQLASPSAV